MELSFSPATEADVEILFSLCKKLIDDYEDLASIDYEIVLAWVKRKITKNIGSYTRVLWANQVVGYFCLDKDSGELDDLYILPEFQGRGIGSAVVQHCIQESEKPLWLYVFKKNTRAIALYARMGFTVQEEVSQTRCIMRK